MVLKEPKRRRKNLVIYWIDYRKTYDVVPHYWIMQCVTMFKIANNVQHLLLYATLLWKVELTSNNKNFGNVEINVEINVGESSKRTPYRLC